jgi:hypothetical protein
MSCANCCHLDHDEGDGAEIAGLCTKAGHVYNGVPVPVWLRGCPKFEPFAIPQADGDGGEA